MKEAVVEFQRLVFHTHDGFIKPNEAPSVLTVARCLMRETRYCGNSPIWWNVGLHSFVVADMLPSKLKLHGLIHDEPECITGDIPRDLKTKKQRKFEDMLLLRFYRSIRITPPTVEEHRQIKNADRAAVNAECWSDCGTACLKTQYSETKDSALVRQYIEAYDYAACLDKNGAAVVEFVNRFEQYKSYL